MARSKAPNLTALVGIASVAGSEVRIDSNGVVGLTISFTPALANRFPVKQ
jgi:hypothetical protein